MLIIDAHQDLAWNILSFGRDYTRSAAQTKRIEAGGLAPQVTGDTVLGWPDYQRGRVALVFATLFAAPGHRREGAWESQIYADANEAHRLYSLQLDAYERLVEDHPQKFRLVHSSSDLESVLQPWRQAPEPSTLEPGSESTHIPRQDPHEAAEQEAVSTASGNPTGLVLLMEGAEGVRQPGELEWWWQRGVRLIGPAWAGTRFCGGTGEPGPLTKEGYQLLEGMADCGFTLDLSHMDEAAALQALDVYPAQIIASHSNAVAPLKASVESNRFLSDRVIRGLLERDGVIGIVLLNSFLKHGWRKGDRRQEVPLQLVVNQIDYICQMAGDAQHVGIGSDFDGGFGLQSIPAGIESIADLRKIIPMLQEKGYPEQDIAAILGENWIRRLQRVL